MRSTTPDQSLTASDCPICHRKDPYYAFTVCGARLVRCHDCDFFYLSPQPSDRALRHARKDAGVDEASTAPTDDRAEIYVDVIAALTAGKRLLEVRCGRGSMSQAAQSRGYQVTVLERDGLGSFSPSSLEGRRASDALDNEVLHRGAFDVCVLPDTIEHVRNPTELLLDAWDNLAHGGMLLITMPHRRCWNARSMNVRRVELQLQDLFYFSRRSLESLLWQCGFESVEWHTEDKLRRSNRAGLDCVHQKAKPGSRDGEICVSARKAPRPGNKRLSIIIPAYNERRTVDEVLQKVEAKQLRGIEKEIIIVESNSTDGTREIVQAYAGRPGYHVVLQQIPRGKGHAIRAGLAVATGGIVLVQDADLEYDLEDYESLLEPIVTGREAFVLGARHGGRSWKMRTFSNQPVLAAILNLAHWSFTLVINISLGIWLKDPFTMYKVFRRDCIHGLKFECDRFDFDWELLIKLVRKGYVPIEIPVNYRSRSFKEGKKIRIFRDPLTWIRAWARSRFLPL